MLRISGDDRSAVPQGLAILMSRYRSPLNISRSVDFEAIKKNAFLDQGILIVSIDDKKLAWQDKEILRQIGTRLYGERRPKE